MNKWIKRGLKLTLFLIAFNTVEHFCHQKTKGFSLRRIQFHQEKPILSNPSETTLSVLNQPFHYHNQGNQCFAFLSEDGQYILKFFKNTHHASPLWTSKIPILNRFKPFRKKRIEKTLWKKNRDFQGYQVAFDYFRQETGLLDLHLHPTSSYPTITLSDKLHIVHRLDLNNTPFILQKRATPIYEQFSSWIHNNQIDKLQQGVTDLISLCNQRISKNIVDDDLHFYSNYGFIDDQPIQIDPGYFILKTPSSAELPTLLTELKKWFSKNYPPMVSHVEACENTH